MATTEETLIRLQKELERRVVVLSANTVMPDLSLLGFTGDPNAASPTGTDGEKLIYGVPVSTRFAQLNLSTGEVEQEWYKQALPNTWLQLGTGGDSSIGDLINRLNSTDASLANKVDKSGDTMTGDLTVPGIDVTNDVSIGGGLYVAGDTQIGGNLTVDGSTIYVSTTELDISTNFINLNTGLTGAPPSWLQSGIVVERGDEDPYVFTFDETDDTFRIGIVSSPDASGVYADSSTQAVATRQDDPISNAIAVWNDTVNRFDTSSSLIFDSSGLYIDGSVKITSLGSSGTKFVGVDNSGNLITLEGVTDASLGGSFTWDASGFLQVDSSEFAPVYNTTLDDTLTMPAAVGGLNAGTTVADLKGDSFTTLFDELLFPTVNPSYTAPTSTFTDDVDSLQEVGAIINPTFTSTLDKGAIRINSVFQDFRSGDASLYDYTDPSSNTLLVDTNSELLSNSQTINGYKVIIAIQQFTSTVYFQEGPQPLDSKGNPYDGPLGAGNVSTKTISIEGVYPLFGTTSSIADPDTKQSLVSMISGNNIVFDMPVESGGNKQSFDIPDPWTGAPTSRPLNTVETYNTVSTSWEDTGLSTWTTSSVTHTIQGEVIDYTRYTYNGPDRGAVQIRLKF